jgi:lysophospholipase L1-like esterase/predicted small secreted protein
MEGVNMKRKKLLLLTLIIVLFLSTFLLTSCSNTKADSSNKKVISVIKKSSTEPMKTEIPSSSASFKTESPKTESSGTENSVTLHTQTTPPIIQQPPQNLLSGGYGLDFNYSLTDEMQSFIDGCVFIGDSICYGLDYYKYIDSSQSLARENIAARNIFTYKEFNCSDGQKRWIADAIAFERPKTIVFWMGMNDINIVSEQEHIKNYLHLINTALKMSPSSEIVVMSISPVSGNSKFTSNKEILKYNSAIKEMIENSKIPNTYFIDLDPVLKSSDGNIYEKYTGDLHLNPVTYKAVLYRLAEVMTQAAAKTV